MQLLNHFYFSFITSTHSSLFSSQMLFQVALTVPCDPLPLSTNKAVNPVALIYRCIWHFLKIHMETTQSNVSSKDVVLLCTRCFCSSEPASSPTPKLNSLSAGGWRWPPLLLAADVIIPAPLTHAAASLSFLPAASIMAAIQSDHHHHHHHRLPTLQGHWWSCYA